MIWLLALFIVLALGIIAFAIKKCTSVKASLNFWSIGFSLETKSGEVDTKKS